jgi:hypothetical protein
MEAGREVAGESCYNRNALRRRSQNVRFTSVVNDIELASYSDSRLAETLGGSYTIGASSSRGEESAVHD